MSTQRIEETTANFVAAAQRARAAGFDCIEIHAAHGYLISQFHTPCENRRSDAYGGSLENRARFGLELTRRVKSAVAGLGVVYRLSVDDFFPEGLKATDGLTIAIWAARSGADAVHVAAGHYRSLPAAAGMIPPMAQPEATFLKFARALKPRLSVPVIAVGRLGEPGLAQAALAQGACDFIALGRPLLADPDWSRKVRAGVPVRRCLACNSCISGMRCGGALHCLVNAETGREVDYARRNPPQGQRIAVLGAGPAGLTYASLVGAANDVVVFERAAGPGGALRLAGEAPRFQGVEAAKRSLHRYVAGLEPACAHLGVRFRVGVDVVRQPEVLAGFDQVVVATGAAYRPGLGVIAAIAWSSGMARWPGLRRLFARPRLLDFLYYRARRPTGEAIARLAPSGASATIIGDAAAAGKSAAAIASAFDAACGHAVSLPASARADGPARKDAMNGVGEVGSRQAAEASPAPTGCPPAACRMPIADRAFVASACADGSLRPYWRPTPRRAGSRFCSARCLRDRWWSPYLPLPRNCAETRMSCSTLSRTPVGRWRFACGWRMIAVLVASGAPHFTPQRGSPQLPLERLAPKHPGGQFSFWRKAWRACSLISRS